MYCKLCRKCNVHDQWTNCKVHWSMSNHSESSWATSEQEVQIRGGAAENWRNWIFRWILLSRFTIFWFLCENVRFYPNAGVSWQNLINIVEDQSDCKLHSFWLLSVWAGQWFSLDEGRLPKKGFAQFFQLPSTSMWTSINLGPWLAPVCFHACL